MSLSTSPVGAPGSVGSFATGTTPASQHNYCKNIGVAAMNTEATTTTVVMTWMVL